MEHQTLGRQVVCPIGPVNQRIILYQGIILTVCLINDHPNFGVLKFSGPDDKEVPVL